MGLIDRWIEKISPAWALKRELSKIQLTHARSYDAAKTSNYHKKPGTSRSGDGTMDETRESIRNLARHLDENHDLAIGVLDDLVNNTIGEAGIMIEPQVKTKGGKLNKNANKAIRKALKEWSRRPETSQTLPFGEAQRLLCRSWFRDGEVLIQHVQGRVQGFNYPSKVPYAFEMIEADYLPFDLNQSSNPKIVHGVELNAWRQPTQYHLYLEHPADRIFYTGLYQKTKGVPARNITHLKFSRRIGQTRGVSVLHGVLNRLDDIKDYEESERIAARLAASMAGYIQKAPDMVGNTNTDADDRSFSVEPGMIFDGLLPGETVGTIDHNRPNTGLESFRDGQMRGVAAGTGTRYSAVAKNYNGTYSAQRQELVEAQPNYGKLRKYFIDTCIDEIYRNFVTMGMTSGTIKLPKNIDPDTLYDYEARGQGMTWIDPKKEVEADILAIENRILSRHQVIRNRGGDPEVTDEQIQLELELDQKNGFGVSVAEKPDGDPAKDQAGESGTPNGDEDSSDEAATA